MPYGTVKVDNVTFTNNSVDATTTFSGIYASITNNLTLSGTATAATFTGTTANFTNVNAQNISVTTSLSGLAITGGTAGFTTITGTTVTGTTANFATVSGTTVTGTTARFITITGGAAGFTTITGTTVTGTTANFVTVSGTTVTGTTASFTSGIFTSLSGTTHTITSGVFALGTAALPSISFVSDPNTGIYSPGADQVAVATNGAQRLVVDASGRVGVGPINNSSTFSSSTNRASTTYGFAVDTYNGASFENTLVFSFNGSVQNVGNFQNFPFALLTNNTERLRITSAGLVGIGTSAPGYTFQVQSGFGITTDGGTGETRLIAKDPNSSFYKFFTFYTQGANYAERMRIDDQGRVGIGTTSPSTILQCYGGISGIDTRVTIGNAATSLNAGVDSSNVATIGTNQNQPFYFVTNGTERARIDSSGRLLVGTSSTSQTATLLIQGNSSIGATGAGILKLARGEATPTSGFSIGELRFTDSGHTSAATIDCQRDGGTWTSGSSQPTRLTFSTTADGASSPTERMRIKQTGSISCYQTGADALVLRSSQIAGTTNKLITALHSGTAVDTGGTASFFVYTNGNVENTNNSYGAISDLKLKENIVDATSQWSDIKALQVRKYNFKEGQTHTQIGLVAQEVELVSPGLVTESPDRDEEGNDLGTVTKSVNYSVLYMKAVKALQEAMERIEQLETEMAAVKAQLS